MTQISILGCGWLGFPVAKHLISRGFRVNGSTTTRSKMTLLKEAQIDPYLINLSSQNTDLTAFLDGSEILLINLPPKLRANGGENYVNKIASIIQSIEVSQIKYVLFIGSTSIYANSDELVTERTKPDPKTESAKQLLQAEELLRSNVHFKTTILRFGGLIGEDRHPVRQLSGKTLTDPKAPINLIQLEDCIKIIETIIRNGVWNETYNACYPEHPSRERYYARKAAEYNVAPPIISAAESSGKTISSHKLVHDLSYTFSKPI